MAAGLGFKTFTTGEVLTAGDTNGYLMQGVLVFASATTRDAAITSPQEGQTCYLKDTDAVMTYSGSAWVAVGGSVPTSYGFAAGKNSIINGDFRFNQRAFTSNTATGSYNFDRWLQTNSGGSFTVTPQTFTAGTAPVSGYESINFLQGITATQSAAGDYAYFSQRIEDVRNDAGTTVVVSFWAKANTGTPKIGVELSQNFGSGGSPSAQVNTAAGSVTLSTSWARYSVSVAIPSISGKTIGTTANTSYLELNLWTSSGATNATRASSIGIQNFTAGIWGVQLEQGTTATAFQTATGTIQGELAVCQRYYQTSGQNSYYVSGTVNNATDTTFAYPLLVTMRTLPTVTVSNVSHFTLEPSAVAITAFTLATSNASKWSFYTTSAGLTANQSKQLFGVNASANLQFSAEL